MANEILENGLMSGKVYFMNPGYPLFLSSVYRILGEGNLKIAVIQSVLSSLASALLSHMLFLLFGALFPAFTGALFYSFFIPALYYDGLLFSASLINSINLFTIYFLFMFLYGNFNMRNERWPRAKALVPQGLPPVAMTSLKVAVTGNQGSRRLQPAFDLSPRFPGFIYIFCAGIFLSLSALLRPNILLFAVFVFLWFFYLAIKGETAQLRRIIAGLALFSLGLLLPLSVIFIRNYRLGGQMVLTTASGGINFYIGNNEAAEGANTPPAFARLSPDNMLSDFRIEASRRVGRPLNEKETSDFWYQEALRFIKNEPVKYLRLLARKAVLFHNHYEIPSNLNLYFVAQYSRILRYLNIRFPVLFAFGLSGMLLFFIRKMGPGKMGTVPIPGGLSPFSLDCYLFLLILFYPAYLISGVAFFILSEYRLPVYLPLSVFAGYLVWKTVESILGRESKLLVLSSVIAGACIFYFTSRDIYAERSFDRPYVSIGMARFRDGDFAGAIKEFEKALVINPASKDAWLNYGTALYRKGNLDGALEKFRQAVSVSGGFADGHLNIGGILYLKRDFAGAEKEYKKVLELMPNHYEGILHLAHSLYMQDKFKEAAGYYRTALSFSPGKEEIIRFLTLCESSK